MRVMEDDLVRGLMYESLGQLPVLNFVMFFFYFLFCEHVCATSVAFDALASSSGTTFYNALK